MTAIQCGCPHGVWAGACRGGEGRGRGLCGGCVGQREAGGRDLVHRRALAVAADFEQVNSLMMVNAGTRSVLEMRRNEQGPFKG